MFETSLLEGMEGISPLIPVSPARDLGTDMLGDSPAVNRVAQQVELVAPTDSSVLICGETGTGKELVARAIHNLSSRRHAPFVKLNCAAIPAALLESELFGHERGAFTGAIVQQLGRFQLADRGTLFLDEIGEMPLELQPKLLRVLQEQEFERLGGARTIRINVRVLAATNRNLLQMMKDKQFRADLYYRLNVFPIEVPPLRARSEDIPLLVRHFVKKYASQMQKTVDHIPSRVMQVLTSYPWPGNIRELQNFIERSVILTTGATLECPLACLNSPKLMPAEEPITLEDAERDHICRTLKQTKGLVAGPNGAAARLGLKRSTLYFRMRKLGIPLPRRADIVSPESGRMLAC
jgi:formate hydrogenlyase transcriptional activator